MTLVHAQALLSIEKISYSSQNLKVSLIYEAGGMLACVAGAKRGGGRGEGEKGGRENPQSPSVYPFLPIRYPFRRLLSRLV